VNPRTHNSHEQSATAPGGEPSGDVDPRAPAQHTPPRSPPSLGARQARSAFGAESLQVAAWGPGLFNVEPLDPLSFAIAPALFLRTALLAGDAPARRSGRIEPVAILREE
jgi:hypothetical protein